MCGDLQKVSPKLPSLHVWPCKPNSVAKIRYSRDLERLEYKASPGGVSGPHFHTGPKSVSDREVK
jgi:hypothetical protein